MKKIICPFVCLLLIVTLCVPAFADEGEQVELEPQKGVDININPGENFIISNGSYRVDCLNIHEGTLTIGRNVEIYVDNLDIYEGTLTIDRDAEIIVYDNLNNNGTLIVLGTLKVYCDNFNGNKVHVGCTGTLEGNRNGPIIYEEHSFIDGICSVCGATKDNHAGSIFSGGTLWLVIGVAAVAIAAAVVIVIVAKKKKPATADGAVDENSEE